MRILLTVTGFGAHAGPFSVTICTRLGLGYTLCTPNATKCICQGGKPGTLKLLDCVCFCGAIHNNVHVCVCKVKSMNAMAVSPHYSISIEAVFHRTKHNTVLKTMENGL